MTEARSTFRHRLTSATRGGIPAAVVTWFEACAERRLAEVDPPWEALLLPESERIGEWWQAWRKNNPGTALPSEIAPYINTNEGN